MPVESATYISGLNVSNPVHASDDVGEGDDHLRLIKATLLNTFPNVTGAMTASHTELNNLDGVTGKTGSGNLVLSASPTFSGTITGLAGSGASLTALNASQLASGTVPDARIGSSSVVQHEGDIDHDALTGFVANEHINHGSVSITAGDGLSGGGTIAANRSLAVDSTVVRTTGTQTIGGAKTFSSDAVFQGDLTVQDQVIFNGIITDDIGASTTLDDYNPSGFASASLVRIVHSATCALRGMAGGVDGRRVSIFNADTTFALNVNVENANSSAANRFATGSNESIPAGETRTFWYDGTSNRWRVIGSV